MHLLGFRFAPRIWDLSDTKLYLPNGKIKYQALAPMIGGIINLKAIQGPTWMPGGKELLLCARKGTGQLHILRLDIQSGQASSLQTSAAPIGFAAISAWPGVPRPCGLIGGHVRQDHLAQPLANLGYGSEFGWSTSTIGASYGAPGIGSGEPSNTQLALKILF